MVSTLATKTKTKLKDVKSLGQQLLSSKAHINNLPLLLNFISPLSPPQFILESLLSLQAFFTTILQECPLSCSASKRQHSEDSAKDDSGLIYRTWLRSKFDEFIGLLIEVLVSSEPEELLKEVILDTFMEFVKMGNGGRFNSSIYQKLLHSIINSETPAEFLSDLLASKYLKYIDVRYFTYISMQKLAKTLESKRICETLPDLSICPLILETNTICKDGNDESHSRESMELCIYKMHYILLCIPPLEGLVENAELEIWSGSGLSVKEGNDDMEAAELPKAGGKQCKVSKYANNVLSLATIAKKMKLKFTKAWMAFLRLPLPVGVYKEVLVTLHQAVIPYLSNPIMLCDFLTRSYDIGGLISVMALSSLFVLMTQHGLEYPNFYEKLYALLVPSIFMAKHRAKFFQLLDSCLKSPLLPAYLAAAFAKKLSRMALSVPPSGSLVIIALIHNLLCRHPSINSLVHQDDGDESAKDDSKADETVHKAEEHETGKENKNPGVDHFNNEEKNPIKSNAMRSSLWEIDTLHHHYCPPVSRFVSSLKNDLTVRSKTTEMNIKDFSSGSYATVFADEIRRRVKQVPLAFYKATPTCLFSESEFVGWTFQCEENMEKYTGNGEQTVANASEWNDFSPKRRRMECS